MRRPRRALLSGLTAIAVLGATAAAAFGVDHALSGRDSSASVATHQATRPTVDHVSRSVDRTVAPLRRLTSPDVIVALHRVAPANRVRRLRARPGVTAVAVLDSGVIRVRGRQLHVMGVSPGNLRGFTPSLTAHSDALWQSVGRGELTVSYSRSRRLRRHLGDTLLVRGGHGHSAALRIGAFASLGIGSAEAVVDHSRARELGLHPMHQLVVSAPKRSINGIRYAVHRLFGNRATVHRLRPKTVDQTVMSDYARSTIPPAYLALYRNAAVTCPGLPWTVLAGIGAVETGHGANVHRSVKGAIGPMQFLPSTFAAYAVDGNGDGVADIHNPADAVYSAARYLCLWGAGRGGQSLYDAVWAYNHADWYVREVLAYAVAYS